MGGHNAGDVASEMAVLQLGNSWRETTFCEIETVKEWLTKGINKENKRIFDAATAFPDLEGMGTTLVASAFIEDTILIANIGDSRAYQFDDRELKQITEDHSFANELRISGQISEEEAENHEKRNTLTRSLGVATNVRTDFFELPVEETAFILLCSDGLANHIRQEEVESILTGISTIEKKADQLVKTALSNGGTDNVSVILIQPAENKKEKITEGGEVHGSR